MRFGVKGVALLQAWLMVFGFVGIVFMMGGVLGASYIIKDGSTVVQVLPKSWSSDHVIYKTKAQAEAALESGASGATSDTACTGKTCPLTEPGASEDSTDPFLGEVITAADGSQTIWNGNEFTPIDVEEDNVGSGSGGSGLLALSGGAMDLTGLGDVSGSNTGSVADVDAALGDFFGDVDAAEDSLRGDTTPASGWTGDIMDHPDSTASGFLGLTPGSTSSALFSGLQWAAIAYGAGTLIGGMLGMSDDNTEALSTAMAAGFGAYNLLSTAGSGTGMLSSLGAYAGPIGLGVAAVVFILMYKNTETKVVSFDCMPWQAPNGGNDCKVCNDDSLPCSEYRCKSLGQGCEIVNSGTTEEKCVYVNPRDVSPPVISPKYDALSVGHEYKNVKNSPPGPGFEIVNVAAGDGCLKAFTPLEFGFSLDEPGQCKIDFNHTESFDDMAAFIGGNNLYSYNHTDLFSLPGASELNGSGFVLENGKDLTFFVRCKDKNGNENGAEYAVNFCIDPSPDSTAPKIEATSVDNDGCVAENKSNVNVVFYANEPSDCKWSFQDKDYDLMENGMSCDSNYRQANAAQLFGCSADLTGIARTATTFYVRCKDQPNGDEADRNKNSESFSFRLRGSEGLVLKNLQPNETISVGISPAPVELYVETLFGCNNGKSSCAWSDDGSNYIQFFDTNADDGIHTQRLDLAGGNHEYFVRCIDGGGNLVEDSIDFDISVDQSAPVIARVYEEGDMLKVVTVRDSECAYTHTDCDFSYEEGVEMPYGNTTIHVADWDEENTYFIKCRDEFQNVGSGCSIIVRPSTNFL